MSIFLNGIQLLVLLIISRYNFPEYNTKDEIFYHFILLDVLLYYA